MDILIGCESSGVIREAFRKLGHNAWSCDLLPADDGSEYHIQGDILAAMHLGWDMLIVHPPCTYLCSSGLHWNHRTEGRQAKTDAALDFVRLLMDAPIAKIATENPVGCIGTQIRKADQYIQPYEFGEDASKKTGLWLKGLPILTKDPKLYFPPRIVADGKYAGKERWSNQTDSGQNRLGPSEDRWKERSKTYQGIADELAEQWG